jgi:multiple sugar transport system substrate-binding protein
VNKKNLNKTLRVWKTGLALVWVLVLATACGGQAPTPVLSPTALAKTPAPLTATPSPTSSTTTPTRTALSRRGPSPTPTPACPAGVAAISVHDWSSMDQEESWQLVIRQFEAANPCIQVSTVRLPDDREARLLEIASGSAPDLVGVDSSDLTRSIALGGLEDLTPFIRGDADFKPADLFDQTAWAAGSVVGMPVAVVKDYSTSAFYINTTLFEQAGIQIPQDGNWTYDDFLDDARLLTIDRNGNNATSPDFDANNVVIWGASLPWWDGSSGWWRGFQNLLYAWDAHTISADGLSTQGYLNSPQAIQAWAWYSDLIHVYHVAPDISLLAKQHITNEDLFRQHRLAIVGSFWGPWYRDVLDQDPLLKWQVVPLPGGPAGHKSTMSWMGWGINPHSKYQQAAWTLLKWLTTDPGQGVFASKALTADLAVAQQLQQEADPFWGVFSRETANLDGLDDTLSPYYTTCVDIPGGALLGRMMAGDGGQFDIQNELDQFAVSAEQCLWKHNPGKSTATPVPVTETPAVEGTPEELLSPAAITETPADEGTPEDMITATDEPQ